MQITSSADEFGSVAEIRALTSERAVLLPFFTGSKNPGIRNWSSITYEDTQDRTFKVSVFGNEIPYYTLLTGADRHRGNVGVSLGSPSDGVCAIDADSTQAAQDLMDLNPALRQTLRTCRKRGEQFWLQVSGPSPRVKPIKTTSGEEWGEWRGTGGMSVLWGEAKGKGETEPSRYRIVNRAKAIPISVEQIRWPGNVVPPNLSQDEDYLTNHSLPCLGSCVPESLSTCVPEYLGHKAETSQAENLRLHESGEALLADSKLTRLYSRYIEPKFGGMLGGRHPFVVQAIPFLYRVVSPEIAMKLALSFFLTHKARFKASAQQHWKECSAHLEAVARTYPRELSDDEFAAYEILDEPSQLVFRVCRDLALYAPADKPKDPLTFFASFSELSDRTGLHKEEARRIIKKFSGAGILEVVEPGTRFLAAIEPKDRKATVYRWRVPMPKAPEEVEALAA